MKVTDIKAQVKTRGRYSIFVDGKFAFGLSELGLIESGIRVGNELTKDQLDAYKSEAEDDKVYNMTLGLIARRPRSEGELKQYLTRKVKNHEQVTKILNKLNKAGFIDDKDFASRWVGSRRLLKKTSKKKLRLELKQKFVSDQIISEVLNADETDELEVLKQLVAKKRTQSRYQDDLKLMQYLTRQGFGYQDVKKVLHDRDDL